MAIEDVVLQLVAVYNGFLSLLPEFWKSFFNLFFLAFLIFAYAAFIWRLHRFISHKNIFDLNFNKYSKTEHPILEKLSTIGLYIVEYLIAMPILISLWFSIFGISLIIFTELPLESILVISAVVVAAVRITAYSNEAIAKEVAKLLPLNLLGLSLLVPGFFEFERVIGNISQVPGFFSVISNYLLFIVILEVILRFFEFLFSLLDIKDD